MRLSSDANASTPSVSAESRSQKLSCATEKLSAQRDALMVMAVAAIGGFAQTHRFSEPVKSYCQGLNAASWPGLNGVKRHQSNDQVCCNT